MLSHLCRGVTENSGYLVYILNNTAVMVKKHKDYKTIFNMAKNVFSWGRGSQDKLRHTQFYPWILYDYSIRT